jgi:hypothetical protein
MYKIWIASYVRRAEAKAIELTDWLCCSALWTWFVRVLQTKESSIGNNCEERRSRS